MGYKEVGRVLKHSRSSGTAKLILVAVAHHDGPGGSWPSRATLAEYANVDEKNARRAIRKLEEAGELRVHVNRGGSDERPEGHRPNLYEILVSCPPECDGSDHHRMPRIPRQRDEGATAPPRSGGEGVQREGATAPPELPREPPHRTIPGSKDLDSESQSVSRKIPVTAAEKADRRKLAKYMTNCKASDVDLVWGWMRTGHSISGRINSAVDRPAALAAKLHRNGTDDSNISEWQGWFRRHYLTEKQCAQGIKPVVECDDPWAASA